MNEDRRPLRHLKPWVTRAVISCMDDACDYDPTNELGEVFTMREARAIAREHTRETGHQTCIDSTWMETFALADDAGEETGQ